MEIVPPSEFDDRVHLALSHRENYSFERLGIDKKVADPAYWHEAQIIVDKFAEQLTSNSKVTCILHAVKTIRHIHYSFFFC